MIWRLAKGATPCGSCGRRIAPGEPLGELHLTGTRRARCYDCASLIVGFCPFVVEDPGVEPAVSWQPLLPSSLPVAPPPSVDVRQHFAELRAAIFGASR